MVLNSQSGREVSRRTHMYRRRRSRSGRRVVGLVVIVATLGVVWWSWSALTESVAPEPVLVLSEENVDPAGSRASDREERPSRDPASAPMTARPPKPAPEAVSEPPTRSEPPPIIARPSLPVIEPVASTPPPDEDAQAAAETSQPAAPRRLASAANDRRLQQRFDEAMRLAAANDPVEARRRLSGLMEIRGLEPALAERARHELSEINERLVFSPEVVPDDPFALAYTIRSGDLLATVTKRLGLQVEWQFIQRINLIPDPRRIREGQRIKLVSGPFNAVVDKSDFRLDLHLGDGADRVFVRSFAVGLGEYNSTPVGRFRVRSQSKMVDPQWRNPRTGESFASDDPANPIGEHWIGLEGIDDTTRMLSGYGIHGTIDRESIGRQASMGCVRMLPEDVAVVWEVLKEDVSTVEIRD